MNIPLSNDFIENELVIAPPNFTVIYIYAYKRYINQEEINVSLIARNIIGLVENDVINALNYWQKKGLLVFQDDTITFTENRANQRTTTTESTPLNNQIEPVVKENTPVNFLIDSKPTYKMEELEFYRKNSEDVDRLFTLAQNAFGKLLSSNDISTLFSFYDWLRLPINVIEILVVYAVENGNGNIRYMEKVALDWHEKGLNTTTKVNEYLRKINKDYRNIFRALGISRELTDIDIELFDKWKNTYGFTNELILEACDKAIASAPNPTLKYVNGILENWHKEGIKTLEEVEVYENKFFEAQKEKSKEEKQLKKPKLNNFTQDQLDLKDIASKERARLMGLYNEENK